MTEHKPLSLFEIGVIIRGDFNKFKQIMKHRNVNDKIYYQMYKLKGINWAPPWLKRINARVQIFLKNISRSNAEVIGDYLILMLLRSVSYGDLQDAQEKIGYLLDNEVNLSVCNKEWDTERKKKSENCVSALTSLFLLSPYWPRYVEMFTLHDYCKIQNAAVIVTLQDMIAQTGSPVTEGEVFFYLNAIDVDGFTPLMHACANEFISNELVNLLIDYSTKYGIPLDLNITDEEGNTALMICWHNRNMEADVLIKFLSYIRKQEPRHNIFSVAKEDISPFEIACEKRSAALVHALVNFNTESRELRLALEGFYSSRYWTVFVALYSRRSISFCNIEDVMPVEPSFDFEDSLPVQDEAEKRETKKEILAKFWETRYDTIFHVIQAMIDRFCVPITLNNFPFGNPAVDRDGWTSIMHACCNGKVGDRLVRLCVSYQKANSLPLNVNAFDKEGNTAIHIALAQDYREIALVLLEIPGIDVKLENQKQETALELASQNKHFDISRTLISMGAVNKTLEYYKRRKPAQFSSGKPVFTPYARSVHGLNEGWMINQERKGVLLLGDANDDDPRPVVFVPKLELYGYIEDDNVIVYIDGEEKILDDVDINSEIAFYYGAPELCQNIVWKEFDSDPSCFLNFHSKIQHFLRPLKVMTRKKVHGEYIVKTIQISVEVLSMLGRSALQSAFAGTEVLSLRNLRGEGCSLTHPEWDLLVTHLPLFPNVLINYLLETNANKDTSDMSENLQMHIVTLLQRLYVSHPLTGDNRLCNKLAHFLRKCPVAVHAMIQPSAESLSKKIEMATVLVYQKLLEEISTAKLQQRVAHIVQTHATAVEDVVKINQTRLTGIPRWYKNDGRVVDQGVIVQLLMDSSSLSDWNQLPNISPGKITADVNGNPGTQDHVVGYLKKAFDAEFNPTHEVLLANGYLKVAQLLLPTFHSTLLKAFGSEKIIIAAIKQLRRIKMKMEEYKNNGAPSPYAACVCDYLRATILCSSLEEVVDTVDSLAAHFKILQVTPRISPESVGNKVIIVHVEVEDKNVRPKKYVWSSWWDQQSVRMIAEVQVAVGTLYYLNKQSHITNEIAKSRTCSEWEHQQGYGVLEKEMFPQSALHNDPLCLL
jgi:ankyrin repeat protein